MKKKILAMFLTLVILIGMLCSTAHAQLSNAYWPISDAFLHSVEIGDDEGIVYNGNRLLEQLDREAQTAQVLGIRATRLNQIALALERLGRYAEAGYYHEIYIPYAQELGWTDGVRIAQEKAKEYKVDLDLYQLTGDAIVYHGAPVEPTAGVYYGVTSDGETRAKLPNESMTILYHEYGSWDFGWFDYRMKEAAQKGIVTEVALNLPGEGNQIPRVPYDEEYIKTFLSHIAPYADTGIILRFAAEFDVWTTPTTPEQYIQAFRTVANLTRQYAPGVALSWSPNQVSGWDVDVDAFYPGDEYVDWVGVSAYSMKYFMGRDDWDPTDKYNEIMFKTGDSAEAVRAIKKIADTYGDRKPLMLSESGFSHYCYSLSKDTTDWAALQMRRAYNYLPMVYPQIKLIAQFDQIMPGETNNFAPAANATIQKLYKGLTTLPTFIQGAKDSALTYKKLGNYIMLNEPTLDISVYIYKYMEAEPTLHFYLDGKWVASSNKIPYTKSISFADCHEGEHILKIKTESGYEKEYVVNYTKSNDNKVSILYNGEKVISDAPARIVGGSTLVPIRAIAEKMGFSVEWDGNQRKVTLADYYNKIELYIGNSTIYVNGEAKTIPVSAQIIDDRTFLPLRAVTEAFGAQVEWDGSIKRVYISR